MVPRLLVGLATAVVITTVSSLVFAGVPCQDFCTVEAAGDGDVAPNAVVCPMGDRDAVIVTVTVSDCFGVPISGMEVIVYPDPEAAGFCSCPGEETKQDTTDVNGMLTVEFARFGGCGSLRWYAEARGVVMFPSVPIQIVSSDIDGSCEIDLFDFVRFATQYSGQDPCCDYDFDGGVNLTDFIRFSEHYSHTCN